MSEWIDILGNQDFYCAGSKAIRDSSVREVQCNTHFFINPFVCLFSKYLSCIYSVSDVILDTWDFSVNEADKDSCS